MHARTHGARAIAVPVQGDCEREKEGGWSARVWVGGLERDVGGHGDMHGLALATTIQALLC